MRASRMLCGAALVVAVATHPAYSQDPAKFFDDNCAMCHAIGGPPGGAPDLKDVTARHDRAWLVQFILNPEETAKRDAAAAALVKQYDGMVMPTTDGATPEIIESVLRYIEASGAPAPTATSTAQPAVRRATPADIANGRQWYEGRRTFTKGGLACVSCHRVNAIGRLGGGTLGPDLTRVHQRLGGTANVATWLKNPPTRVMRAVFKNQPLSDDETFALVALLGDEMPGQGSPATPPGTRRFLALALGLALVALTAMATVWWRRLTGVRRAMVTAARRRAGDEP